MDGVGVGLAVGSNVGRAVGCVVGMWWGDCVLKKLKRGFWGETEWSSVTSSGTQLGSMWGLPW